MPPEHFDPLEKVIPKISNPFSLAALALLLFNNSLYLIKGPNLEPWKPVLLASSLVAALLMLLILRPRKDDKGPASAKSSILDAISLLIECSNLPMYFADSRLVVKFCNKEFAQLLDTTPAGVLGGHLSDALGKLAHRVPEPGRAAFLDEQRKLIGKIASDLGPNLEAEAIIDNRDLPGNTFRGVYQAWIHSDKIRSGSEVIGILVFYRLQILNSR